MLGGLMNHRYWQASIIIIFLFAPALGQYIAMMSGTYWVGFMSRVMTHVGVPVLFSTFFYRTSLFESFVAPLRMPWCDRQRGLLTGVWLGGLGMIVIFVAYRVFGPWLNLSAIAEHLSTDFSVTPTTYPFVALGIVLTTPFLEEYFWRGWVYRSADKLTVTVTQHQAVLWLTGLAFALHHVVIFSAWFVWWQLLIATLFLALVGVLFNYLFRRWQSIVPGLITHILADLAIVIIGFNFLV